MAPNQNEGLPIHPEIQLPGIEDFYSGRSVFVTGATGFMGKALLEKLLRSCTGIKRIYVLLRPKRDNGIQQRLDAITNNKLFDRLRSENPDVLSKLVPVAGDVTIPNLGISSQDLKLLEENVSVVYHSAATVRFDEPLKRCLEVNVFGTQRVMDLCRRLPLISSVVHVSTAYSNCDRSEIDEIIYPSPISPSQLMQASQWMDDDMVEALSPKLLKEHPNTYTYAKALAESVAMEASATLPVAIFRPSIVVATWKEPVPGWVDNINGPTGLIMGITKGVVRTMYVKRELAVDFIPADVVINMAISISWYIAVYRPENIVFNGVSGNMNKLLWDDFERNGKVVVNEEPITDAVWYPDGSLKSSKLWNDVTAFFVHTTPAYAADVCSALSGKRLKYVQLHNRIGKALGALEYFTTHEWKWKSDNMMSVLDAMDEGDKKLFDFDMRQTFHWPDYFVIFAKGMKKFLLNEGDELLPQAKSHLKKLLIIHRTTQAVGLLALARAALYLIPSSDYLWTFTDTIWDMFSNVASV